MITLFWHYMHGFWKKVVWGWKSNVKDNVIKGHQPHLPCGVYDHTAPFNLVPFYFLFIPFVSALSFLAGWPSWGFLLFSGDYFPYLASRERYDTIWYGGVILPSCLSQISNHTSEIKLLELTKIIIMTLHTSGKQKYPSSRRKQIIWYKQLMARWLMILDYQKFSINGPLWTS